MGLINKLYFEMISYFSEDPKRIQHLAKVHSLAKLIGETEKLDKNKQFILEAVALIHDIGVKPSIAKYNSSDGSLQEQEGPKEAYDMLMRLGFNAPDIDRICYIVGNHHTYSKIDDLDFQILIEADLMANFYEDNYPKDNILLVYDRYFKTGTGIRICEEMFGIRSSL